MVDGFEFYAKKLDDEIEKFKTLKEIKESNRNAREYFFSAIESLKAVVQYIGANNISDHIWHKQINMIKFSPTNSPYFRLGNLGECENVEVNDYLLGFAGFGYDESLDYENQQAKAEMVIFYSNGHTTDIDLFDSKDWRRALNEFFEMRKVE